MQTVFYITSLRALSTTGIAQGEVVHLLCHSLLGDGGEGFWTWDTYSTRADNTGIVVKPDGVSGAGRWLRQFDGLNLDPRWFGARAGNSSWDSASAIQAAIDCEPVSYGNGTYAARYAVKFSRGVYYIGTTLIRRVGTVITGAPSNNQDTGNTRSGTLIKLMPVARENNVVVRGNCSLLVDQPGHNNFASLENISFDGSASEQDAEAPAVVLRGSYVSTRLRNVHISNVRGRGLEILDGADIRIENVWINGTYTTDNFSYGPNASGNPVTTNTQGKGALYIGIPNDDSRALGNISISSLYVEHSYLIENGTLTSKLGTGIFLENVAILNADTVHLEEALTGIWLKNCKVINITGVEAVDCGRVNASKTNGNYTDNTTSDWSVVFFLEWNKDSAFLNLDGAQSTRAVPGLNWLKNSKRFGGLQPVDIPDAYNKPLFQGYHWRDTTHSGIQRGYGAQDAFLDWGVSGINPEILLYTGLNRSGNKVSMKFTPGAEGRFDMSCTNGSFSATPFSIFSRDSNKRCAFFNSYPVNFAYDAAVSDTPEIASTIYCRSNTLVFKHVTQGEMTFSMGKTGSGAPTTSAAFLGQRYIDTTNRHEYVAVNTGTGTSDWKQTTV